MDDWIIAATVGSGLFLVGLTMIRAHAKAWNQQKHDTSLDEPDRLHYHQRFRRRIQTSGLIALLGILIAIGDSPLIWGLGPQVSTYYWLAVLALTGWVVLIALGDLGSSRAHTRIALSRVRQKQRELEAQVARIKARRSNGRPDGERQ